MIGQVATFSANKDFKKKKFILGHSQIQISIQMHYAINQKQ